MNIFNQSHIKYNYHTKDKILKELRRDLFAESNLQYMFSDSQARELVRMTNSFNYQEHNS